MFRVISHIAAAEAESKPADRIVLAHDERRLRRKMLKTERGSEVLVDFSATTTLCDRDRLTLEDGRSIEVVAAVEPLLEVTGRDAGHLTRLAWHIGNRHLPAEIDANRLLIRRDRIIAGMLAGLGAGLREIDAPFNPEPGAYHTHAEASHVLLNR